MMTVVLAVLGTAVLGLGLGVWMERALLVRSPGIERVFSPVEGLLLRVIGADGRAPMGWRAWARALLVSNGVLAVVLYGVFLGQGGLPLNPDAVPGMSWDLALHTAASFVTNTNQQHYSGQAQLSHFAQLAGVTAAQVLTPAVGLACLLAALRGLRGGESVGDAVRRDAVGDVDLGNHWGDVLRAVTRVLLPLATVWALLLAAEGVPTALRAAAVAVPLDASAGVAEQVLPRGPMAPMVAIKQLGTNGGGWYGPNSAAPFENPTPLSNLLQLVAILLVPVGCAVMAGRALGRGVGRLTLVSMAVVALGLGATVVLLEQGANPAFDGFAAAGPNWEGKELRNGVESSALWAAYTTMTSNGSVNAMHDSLLPLSGLVPLAGMFVNAAFGGVGVGWLNFLLYSLVAVFVGGLLIGRAPAFLDRKLEVGEVRLVAVAVLLPALTVLVPSALTLSLPGGAGMSNPGPHGISQVIYEYASASANNGSGFEGLADNTPWWNVSTAIVLILSRFIPILVPLAVAGLLAAKRPAPPSAAAVPLGSPAMILTVLAVIVVLQLLTWVPAMVLGPVAEHLVAVPALVAGAR